MARCKDCGRADAEPCHRCNAPMCDHHLLLAPGIPGKVCRKCESEISGKTVTTKI